MNYWQLIKKYYRYLLFAVIHSFFSTYGQTILVGQFRLNTVDQFPIDDKDFGMIYTLVTLLSALILPASGSLLDKISLRKYMTFAVLGLSLGYMVYGVAESLTLMIIGLFLLRFFGQGIFSHISATSTARYFEKTRGKALSIASTGHALGEAVIPPVMIWGFYVMSWQDFMILMALPILLMIPLINLFLIQKTEDFNWPVKKSMEDHKNPKDAHKFTKLKLLKDPFFYGVMPLGIMPGFILTGLFLYPDAIENIKAVEPSYIGTVMFSFATAKISASFLVGPLIDRFTARRLYPYFCIPLVIGLSQIYFFYGESSIILYLVFAGIAVAISHTIQSAMWSEVYGTRHLGAIRSTVTSVFVFSTSLAPLLFGWLKSMSIDFHHVILSAMILVFIASVLAFFTMKMKAASQ